MATTSKKTGPRMHSALVHWPGLDPEHFVVSATVMRRDGADLTPEDLEVARAAVPSAEKYSDLLGEDDVAPKAGTNASAPAKAQAKASPVKRGVSKKRAAAKRPTAR